MANSTKRGTFPAGRSGNPAGRPPGSGEAAAWRAAIGRDVGKVITVVTKLALSGDLAACKLVLERAVPSLKPMDSGVVLPMPADGTLTDKAAAMVTAMAAGVISAQAAAAMISALANMVRVTETDDVVARLEALESETRKEQVDHE